MRTSLLVTALVTSTVLSSVAAAQESLSEYSYTARDRKHRESPQNVAIELRVGRYVPNVDSEFADAPPGPGRPYEYMFGNSNRYSIGFEVDYQALRIPYLGTLGPGIGFAYTKSSASAFLTDSNDIDRGSEPTSLTIFPMYLVGVLRADVIARETPVPLVPYLKLGVGYALWTVSAGEDTANVNGVVGRGASYGPQFALGGMFLLDSIDRASANELDANFGVNNSYLFVEWFVSHLDGFNAGDQLQVGTNTWVLGLALEI